MLARRYELKFPLTAYEAADLLERARHALVEDEHGVRASYRVSSQYFDTPDFQCYREKVDGERARRKFRLRYYSVDEGRVRNAFMEIKHRINNTVFKERVPLSDDGAQAILENSAELHHLERHVADDVPARHATIEQVKRAAQRAGFDAVHVITYKRAAWEGRVDRRLRVTFDTQCRALLPSEFAEVETDHGRPILADDRAILEIKFDQAIPRWIRDLVEDLDLKSRRFSKFARGVEVLHPDARLA